MVEEQPPDVPRLGRGGRIVASVSAFVLTGAGGAAVFLSSNQAGTAVLLAVGALFGFIAVTGLVPLRIKFGDNEIVWADKIASAIKNQIKEAEPATAERLTAAVVSTLPVEKREEMSASLLAFHFEDRVRSILQRTLLPTVAISAVGSPGSPDIIVTGDQVVAVEVKRYRAALPADAVRQFITMARSTGGRVSRWVLVTSSPLTPAAQRELSSATDINVHVIYGEDSALESDLVSYFRGIGMAQ